MVSKYLQMSVVEVVGVVEVFSQNSQKEVSYLGHLFVYFFFSLHLWLYIHPFD